MIRKSTLLLLLAFTGCGKEGYLFVQPTAVPTHKVDEAYQIRETVRTDAKIDMLWVIDNSRSMESHQNQVIVNTQSFIDNFTQRKNVDWKMGLISTSTAEPPYLGFKPGNEMDYKTPNPVPLFQNAVRRLGTDGDGYEKTFDPVVKALSNFPKFTRPDAVLSLIIITDAPEQSRIDLKKFMNQMLTIKGDPKKFISYGIFAAMDLKCKPGSGETQWYFIGSVYESLIKQTLGQSYDLCDPFGTSLAKIGYDIVKKVDLPRIVLRTRPVSGTLHVFFLGKELPGGPKEKGGLWFYDYEFNAIVFYDLEFAPGENEKIQVTYDEEKTASNN